MLYDVSIVGAGPVGLACALESKRRGLRTVVLEKGALGDSIRRWPEDTLFFSEAKNIEIGGYPLVTTNAKPSRREALHYYRKVAEAEGLEVITHAAVETLHDRGDAFELTYTGHQGRQMLESRFVIVATGYFDRPNTLGVPGEDLPHVTYHYREPIQYWKKRVTVVGGSNSAMENALDLYRNGAQVTVVHRGEQMRETVKYWLAPDFQNRVREGSIRAEFGATVESIHPDKVVLRREDRRIELLSDFVLINAGFSAMDDLLQQMAVRYEGDKPVLSGEYESSHPGLFVAGSAGFGGDTRSVFIENGREHAARVAEALARRKAASAPVEAPVSAAARN